MKKLISIILPIYNESKNIDLLISRLKIIENQLNHKYNFEYIIIDDGSKDNSLEQLKKHSLQYSNIKIIHFFKNFGQSIAIKTGYKQSNGNFIITMDSDLQDPPETIPKMISEIEKGVDIVYIRKKNRHDGIFKKITAYIFYKIIYFLSNKKIPQNVAYFKIINKNVLEKINSSEILYKQAIISFFDFKYSFIDIDRPNRSNGKTNYNILKMLKLAFNNIFDVLKIFSKTGRIFFYIISFFIITPFFILCLFNQPSAADDFCFAFDRKTENIINITNNYYNNWSFRYSETLLHYLNPMIYFNNINLYKLITPIFLILFFISLYTFVKNIFKLNKSTSIIISLTISIIYLSFMPSVVEGIYWFSGSFAIYQTGIILILLTISNIIKIIENRFNKKTLITTSFLLILLAGIGEIFIFAILPILLFIFIFYFIKNDHKKWLYFYYFILFSTFSSLSITAPGNFIRQSLVTNKSFIDEIIFKFKNAAIATISFPIQWMNLTIILSILLLLIYLSKQTKQKQQHINPILLLTISSFSMFSGFFIIQWPMIAQRNLNVFYFLFILILIINIFNLSNYLKNKKFVKPFKYNISEKIKILLILVIFTSIFIQKNNITTAYKDLISGKAYKYNIELNERYKIIEDKKYLKNIILKQLENKPESIYFLDITKSKNDLRNKCYANFFNLEAVLLK